jgi:hypothetical protein
MAHLGSKSGQLSLDHAHACRHMASTDSHDATACRLGSPTSAMRRCYRCFTLARYFLRRLCVANRLEIVSSVRSGESQGQARAAALEIQLTPNLSACAQPKPHRHHRGQRGRGGCVTQVCKLEELATSLTPPWPRPHTLGHDSVLAATVSPRLTASGCTTGWSDRDKKREQNLNFSPMREPLCHSVTGRVRFFLHNALPT